MNLFLLGFGKKTASVPHGMHNEKIRDNLSYPCARYNELVKYNNVSAVGGKVRRSGIEVTPTRLEERENILVEYLTFVDSGVRLVALVK